MQIDAKYEELLILAIITLLALFWLWPRIAKGIVNRLKKIGKFKKQD